ncbi:MAG TPA: putative metal-binding motif-containing protein [Polyangia bacterium]|nr:putative metal-binding motif-containing protein [Polyangia bacterium]
MSLRLLLAGALLGAACSSDVTNGGMSVGLRAASNVDTNGIQSIKLSLYCKAGTACDQLLKMARSPHDPSLGPVEETPYFQPGSYLHWVPTNFSGDCTTLYVEAYATPGPGKVLAAGCQDITPPAQGSVKVMVEMISVNDNDGDGWIGQFNFPDGTHRQGPDCNDNDARVYPGATEDPCTGDRNCDGMATCNRECQSNADCANKPGRTCCNLSSYVCEMCPASSCSTSSECTSTHCCQRQSPQNMCVPPTNPKQCQCINTSECLALAPVFCCVSNQNTAPDLSPGTCSSDVNTHSGGFYTEWCRCQSSAECDQLFGLNFVCCVSNRMVCDLTRSGEFCLQ